MNPSPSTEIAPGSRPHIHIDHLTKDFLSWADRPSTLKSILVDLLRGKFHMGRQQVFHVLDDVSFTIKPGEFVGILGKNGAGKSTLLKLISGIYTPTSGKITLNAKIAPLIELGAGFHPDLSGYENIFLNAAILGFGRQAALDALPKILEFCELGDQIYMPVRHYSSGMLVRLGFAVATHLDAEILLIDEVLAVGDAGFQEKCLRRIRDLHQSGRTVILITHDYNAVRRHCQRALVFADRKLAYDGGPEKAVEIYLASVGAKGVL